MEPEAPTGTDLEVSYASWNDVRVADKNLTAIHNGMPGGIMAFSERAWRGGDIATCDHGPYGTVIPRHDEAGMKGFEEFEADGQPQRTLSEKRNVILDTFTCVGMACGDNR